MQPQALIYLSFLSNSQAYCLNFFVFICLMQVVVRNIPHVSGRTVSETVDHFFQKNHPNHYIGHQVINLLKSCLKNNLNRSWMISWLPYTRWSWILVCKNFLCYIFFNNYIVVHSLVRLSTMQTNLLNLWEGETGFKIGWTIINLSLKGILIRGQRWRWVLAVNSSCYLSPW